MFLHSRKQALMVAIVLGIAAAGVTAYYTSRVTEASQVTERLVVAKTNIPARAKVTADMLTVKGFTKSARLPAASANVSEFLGKTTKQPIFAGEQVLSSRFFQQRAESGLAFVIPPGHRAIAVGVDERIAVGGHVAAGDHVDLIGACTVDPPNAAADKSQGKEMTKGIFALQDVEVLAVAKQVEGEEQPDTSMLQQVAGKPSTPGNSTAAVKAAQAFQAKTVTLSLTPAEAESVVLMENTASCHLKFALRAMGDDEKVQPREEIFNPSLPLVSPQSR